LAEVIAKQHAVLDKRIKIGRFDIRVAQGRNAIGPPLIGTNEQHIQLIRHRFSNLPRGKQIP
jgi:hypothetical protein